MKTSAQVNAPRYSRERWEVAQSSWRDGEPWSDEWRPWRHLAAEHGIPEAPDGTQWDQWDDDEPSERAMLIRAIRETPEALRAAIVDHGTHSWASVIAIVIRGRDSMRQDMVEPRGSSADPPAADASALLRRIRMVTDEADGPRVLAAIREGRCPTCGKPL